MKRMAVACFFVAIPALAKVGRSSLSGVVKGAALVAVVRVDAVDKVEGHRWARAEVEKVVRGHYSGKELFFLAQGTWTCDISEAVVGERALVVLDTPPPPRPKRIDKVTLPDGRVLALPDPIESVPTPSDYKSKAFRLAHAGRGRMPLREVAGVWYATVWDDVALPPWVRVIAGPDPRYEFIRSAELTGLLHAISTAQ